MEQGVIDALARRAHAELDAPVKAVVVGEIRAQIKARISEILATETFADGKGFKDYVYNRLTSHRSVYGGERVGFEAIVERVAQERASEWFREIAEPHMTELKEKIIAQFTAHVVRS